MKTSNDEMESRIRHMEAVSIMLSWSADAFLHCCEILCEDSMDKSTFVANQFVFVNPAAKAEAVTVLRLSVSSGESRKQVKRPKATVAIC